MSAHHRHSPAIYDTLRSYFALQNMSSRSSEMLGIIMNMETDQITTQYAL